MQHQQLVLDYMPLAKKMARDTSRRTPPNVSEDELRSVAYMGLVSAALHFDESRGSFAGYARIRISGELKDHLRRLIRYAGSESLRDYSFESYDTNSDDFFEFISTKLNEAEFRVVKMYYIECMTLKEIGKIQGLGESRISQIMSGAVRKLRIIMKGRK